MANPILLKHNSVSGVLPTAGSLLTRELAINTADGRLFTKTTGEAVVEFARTSQLDTVPRVATSLLGVANGVATLNGNTKVPYEQLPSYIDTSQSYANFASLPITGSFGIVYITTDNYNAYRWTGSAYTLLVTVDTNTVMDANYGNFAWSGIPYLFLSIGKVDSVAGKTGIVTLLKGDVGLSNVDNTSDVNKPVSTAQTAAISTAKAEAIAASTPIAHVGTTGASHGVSSSSVNGFMSSTDKIKLDAISSTYSLISHTHSYVATNTAITAGTNTKITYDAKGLVTAGTTLAATDIPSLDWSKITSGKPTTLSGYGITDAAPSSHTSDAVAHMTSSQNAFLDAIMSGNNNVMLDANLTF